ncbi:MAG: hypothetical protein J6V24_03140, partial [Clostridia bacterium]|nr:hypothetical protein [Clostridia bacterium]
MLPGDHFAVDLRPGFIFLHVYTYNNSKKKVRADIIARFVQEVNGVPAFSAFLFGVREVNLRGGRFFGLRACACGFGILQIICFFVLANLFACRTGTIEDRPRPILSFARLRLRIWDIADRL